MYLTKTQGNLNPRGQQPQSNLQVTTVRSFEGGLNVTDTDLNMSPKYAKVLDNIERNIDGSLSLRAGSRLLSTLTDNTNDIVNIFYFNGYIITVQVDGSIHNVAPDGSAVNMLLGGVSPWGGGITEANFTIFNSNLILVNGRDKPLIIEGRQLTQTGDPNLNYMQLQMLVDPASGSNVNVPVCKYVITHGKYLCMAGSIVAPSTLFVSSTGTSGTWFGDDPPNDAVNIDIGSRVSLGSGSINGLAAYRDKLIVGFTRGVLPMTLGVFTGDPSVHSPTDDGFIEEFGVTSHRGMVSVGDDIFYHDRVGVNSVVRVNVLNTLRPVRVSHLIDPLTTEAMSNLTDEEIQQKVFAVYDLRHFRYILFIPRKYTTTSPDGVVTQQVESVGYSYTNIPALKITAWSRLRGWSWNAACRTGNQAVVFARQNKLYFYDFDNPDTAADMLDDTAYWNGDGVPIDFEWELPWADMKHREDIKRTRYIGLDTKGDAEFTVEAYVDNIVTHSGDRAPLLSMAFVGGDAVGYGAQEYGDSGFGGSRRSSDERLYAFPSKFKLLKLRVIGSTKRKLKFISISLAFLHGGIRR